MNYRKKIMQNFLIFLPFLHLLIINRFQIRTSEIIKLSVFLIFYLTFFNLSKFVLEKYIPLKNVEYFTVIIFYLSFNYSNITIFIYFEAFDFLKVIPNYSFILFVLFLGLLLVISRKNYFEKIFEFITVSYFVLICLIFFNSINLTNTNTSEYKPQNQMFEDTVLMNDKPNIYFVIYDGLPSLPTMELFYKYEISSFENLLKNNNIKKYTFATSSFGRTTYTMTSLFNMEYIFNDGDIPFEDRSVLSKSFRDGETVFENILRNNNYTIYKFGLSFICNEKKGDRCLNEQVENYVEKDSVYIDLIMRTPAKIFVEKGYLDLKNNKFIGCKDNCGDPPINEIFNNIEQNENPKAVFLHFMDTHGPYLLGKDCKPLDEPIYDLPKTNIDSYQKSLDCAYKKIKSLIKNVNLEEDIIFIQSDHGPNYEKMELTDISELSINQVLNRYSVFSASNLENFCSKVEINLNETVNTFVYFINCFSENKINKVEAKNFLAFGKVNTFVYDVTDLVQNIILNKYAE